MNSIPPPQAVSTSGNVLENWNYFKAHWKNYIVATELDEKPESIKVATLLSVIGKDVYLIYQHLDLTDEERQNSTDIIKALSAHFEPSINIIFERSKFNEASQDLNETVEQYVCRLRKLASTCNYGTMLDELIRDRLVLGILDRNTKKQLISDPKLTLHKAIDICKSNEITCKQIESLSVRTENLQLEEVHKMKKEKPKDSRNERNAWQRACKFCGLKHEFNRTKCPAFNKTCRVCNQRNHWASVCQNKRKQVKELHENEESDSSESCNQLKPVFKINDAKKLMTNLILQVNKCKKEIRCQMDTGATVNVMSIKDLRKLCQNEEPCIGKSKIKLRCYGGKILKTLGQVKVQCWRNSKSYPIIFQIVDTKDNPLLSADTCQDLNLLEVKANVCSISQSLLENEPLLKKYKDVFNGLGCIQGEYQLQTKSDVVPVKQPPRRVPIPLREELRRKLEEMTRDKIICKVTHPTEWISNLVIVKTSKKLRICLDPQNLNVALKRSEYPIPTIEEIMPNLHNVKIFSVVDTKDGFWNIKLTEGSTDLTTFWTPFGRYKFLRLPFGICTASEEYQRRLHEVFEGLDGIMIIADDILIVGRGCTEEEARLDHDRNLENLLERAKEANVKFNKNKIKLRMKEVKYLGHIFTPEGLKADPEKVKAVTDMPKPKDVQEIKSFLGFITYLSRFMPKLSAICEPLRRLTVKKCVWKWSSEHEKAFQSIKALVSKAPILGYYDPNRDITIQADASKAGVGAVLMQEGQPIMFASKSLSKTEQQYAQIEKECLAIVFACERFHQFISGKSEIQVETDHKPLEVIFKKDLLKAPRRLQRMLLRLQKYSLNVKFKQGKNMVIADILSRASLAMDKEINLSFNIFQVDPIYEELSDIRSIESLNIFKDTYERVKRETLEDPSLSELKTLILDGWPDRKEETSLLVRQYWTYKEDLSIQDGIIFKCDRILVPMSMRQEMIVKAHQGHMGINSSLRRARDTLFWPRMTTDLKEKIENCEICNITQSMSQKQPMQSHEIPDLPWERVSVDLCEKYGKYYLILVDHYSDYIEVDELTSISSNCIINHCKQHFSRYGIPKILISDNAKQFMGSEFANFSQKWQFKHVTSSPYHSQGNGKAEAAVKIVKNIIKKSNKENDDLWLCLLNWRNTPTVNINSSPVQRLMSRRTRSQLPISKYLLKPKIPENVSEGISLKRRESKMYYDRKVKELPELEIGQEVYVRKPPVMAKVDEKWMKGSVVKSQNSRSYDIHSGDKIIRRNRSWLKETVNSPSKSTLELPIAEEEEKEKVTEDNTIPIDEPAGRDKTPEQISESHRENLRQTRSGRIIRTPEKYKD